MEEVKLVLTLSFSPWVAVGISVGLVIFGIGYNAVVAWVNRHPSGHEGYTALLVVIGVAITVLATTPLIGIESLLVLIIAFCCSGAPMIAGDVIRYIKARDRYAQTLNEDARQLLEERDGDT
jgi:predicted tellurium resistance membrane protein TerC